MDGGWKVVRRCFLFRCLIGRWRDLESWKSCGVSGGWGCEETEVYLSDERSLQCLAGPAYLLADSLSHDVRKEIDIV